MPRVKPAMRSLLALPLLVFAGCLDASPTDADVVEASADAVAQTPACKPADTNSYGTRVNDLYVGSELWRETNGVHGLQKTVTCEGEPDTRVA